MAAIQQLHNIELSGFLKILNASGYLDIDKNELRNARIQNLAVEPASPVEGQIFYNTAKNLFGYWNGSAWVYPALGNKFIDTNSVDMDYNTSTNELTANVKVAGGGGVEITGSGVQLANSGVSSGTYTKVTVDAKGRVTTGANIGSGDLPAHNHTSTDVTDFHTAVRTNRLDQMANPTANLNLNGQKITNLAEPTASGDAATKNYVDGAIAGLKWKASVKVATTANITLSGAQTIDGVAVGVGDRVLVKNQNTASQNGIYVVAASTWSRATDADAWTELVSAAVFVEQGTVNADSAYTCTSDAGGTLGSTAVTWTTFAGTQTFSASLGVQKVGNDFRASFETDSIELNGNNFRVKTDTTKAIERTAGGLAVKADGTTIEISGGTLSLVNAYRTRKFVGTITGNGSAKTFAVTHNFATREVIVEVYDPTTYDTILLGVTRNSTNQVTVEFAVAPVNAKQYTVVVIG
ncbi:MAG: hypothetical protein KF896_14465 [Ignavibacteriae bacterium]|nr:hypothetical protein [Ignavibacteriota bacterium]